MEDQSSRSDQNEHHLTLACLPYDIVRKIIQIEGVSMGQMALVRALFFFRRYTLPDIAVVERTGCRTPSK